MAIGRDRSSANDRSVRFVSNARYICVNEFVAVWLCVLIVLCGPCTRGTVGILWLWVWSLFPWHRMNHTGWLWFCYCSRQRSDMKQGFPFKWYLSFKVICTKTKPLPLLYGLWQTRIHNHVVGSDDLAYLMSLLIFRFVFSFSIAICL